MNGEAMIIDSFAGGGGASTGIEMALGRSPDVAINHSADALAMHEVNHPETLHLDSNIWDVSPSEVVKGRRVGLFWASPDCKHFSKAKGGKPLDRNIRDLAWVVVRWAEEVKPDVIILENVEEFVTWGPLYEDGRPIVELRGHTFEDWTRRLRRAGYKVQWRELRACDYGAPTIRKRFFMIARRDGLPIVWPRRTHGDPRKPDDAKLIARGQLKPWRTAAEIIDWSLPCPSIFDTSEEILARYGVRAIRPLAEATMRRIARGVVRYVLEAKKPFIVSVAHGHSGGRREYSLDDPLATVQANGNSHGVVVPVVTYGQQGGGNRDAGQPIHTITASPKDQNAVIVPSVVRTDMASAAARNGVNGLDEPLRTQTTAGSHAVVAAHLTKFQSNSTGSGLDEPAPTITANSYVKRPGGAAPIGVVAANLWAIETSAATGSDNPDCRPDDDDDNEGEQSFPLAELDDGELGGDGDHFGLSKAIDPDSLSAARARYVSGYLVPRYGERDGQEPRVRSVEDPAPVVVPDGNGGSLAAVHLSRFTQNGTGSAADEPVDTVMAGAPKFGVVAAFMAKHNTGVVGNDMREPVSTLTSGGAFGVSQHGVVAAHMMRQFGTSVGHAMDEPAHTDTATVNKSALIAPFLSTYYGNGDGQAADGPLRTDTTKDRFGLVTVEIDGQAWAIADIGMRMLTPRERFRAQGFPDSYIIDRRPDGSPISATVQGSCCGNSVCPPLAAALVAANCGHLVRQREAAE